MRRLVMILASLAILACNVPLYAQLVPGKKTELPKALPPTPTPALGVPGAKAAPATKAAPTAALPIDVLPAPTAAELSSKLISKTADERHDAADGLGELGSQAVPAIGALSKALEHEDAATRWRAARALASIGPPAVAAATPLTKSLSDADPLVRAHAARALGTLGEGAKTSIHALLKATGDEDKRVRRASLMAVLQLKPGAGVIMPLVVKALEDQDPSVIMPALHTLAETGDAAVPMLVDALKNDKARYWALLGLADLGPKAKSAVEPLARVLSDEKPEIRMQAALALAEIGPDAKSAVPALVKSAADQQMSVRYASSFALARIGGKDGIPTLQTSAKSEDPMLRLIGTWGLAQISPDDQQIVKQAVDAIVAALESKDARVRAGAIRAMTELKAPSELVQPVFERAIADVDPQVIASTAEALVAQGAKAVPRVANGLKSDKLRLISVRILTRIGPAAVEAVPALVEAMKGDDLEFRREVQLALAAIGPSATAAMPELIKVLSDDKVKSLHPSACYALGRIGPAAEKAVPALRKAIENDDMMTKMAAIWALRQIQPNDEPLKALAVPLMIGALSNERELVRVEAANALGDIGMAGPAVMAALKKASGDESDRVRAAAAGAMKKISGGKNTKRP